MDLAAAYGETKAHLVEIVLELDEAGLATVVPASPAWTVKDVVGHLTGVAKALAEGEADFLDAGVLEVWRDPRRAELLDALTARQVASRKSLSLAEVVEEWSRAEARMRPILSGEAPVPARAPPFVERMVNTDLAVHAQDIRGAIGRPGDRESAGVGIALGGYAALVGWRIQALGLPALRLRYEGKERILGEGDPPVTLEGERFEIFRALAGRRSRGQIRALGWTGDPEPYLGLIPAYGEREDPLVE